MASQADLKGAAAGIVPRLAAWAIDIALLALAVQAAQWTFFLATGGVGAALRSAADWFLFLTASITLPVLLFLALAESSALRATPGKRLLGLRVVDVYGRRISFSRALVRSLVKLVPWQAAHWALCFPTPIFLPSASSPGGALHRQAFLVAYVLLGIDLAAAMMTRRKQSVHDLAAGTYVVRRGAGGG